MESKTTSKTSCLKALLLRAWRERWSDVQWGIYIKTVLPRGVSGDVYNLADCILQQALVGSGANQLVLSYLKHSISAQLVSHAAVLSRLAKFDQFQKFHCLSSLLDFLEGILPGATCCGKSEETKLAVALLATTIWLLQIIQHVSDLKEKATALLRLLLADKFYVAMMCLARFCDTDMFKEMCQVCHDLEGYDLNDILLVLQRIDPDSITPKLENDPVPGSLIQAWLAIQLLSNPGTSTPHLAQRLRLLQTLKRISDARLCSELMRGSLICLNDVNQTQHESQWGAFAFLKVPNILNELHVGESVAAGVELLLQHSPLLDAMDAQSSCSTFDCLLKELTKVCLLSEGQSQQLSSRRHPTFSPKLDTVAGIPKVIICAEPTLNGILKTLSSDKIQDALLGMLHQVLTGKSFELILAVATVQGQLKTLVQLLIRFNEGSKQDKNKAQLFDISFIMLVAIIQKYGADAVLDGNGDSLVECWINSCMVESTKPKAPEQLLRLSDPATIELLLRQFNAGESDIIGNSIKWGNILFSMSGVMREVLVAWEQGVLAAVDVKRILDAVRGKMCCLPLAAAAWLCSYMRAAPHDTLLKPVNMVQQLLAPLGDDDSERWQLTCEIIRKMQRDIQLPLQPKSGRHLVSKQPAAEQLHNAWTSAIQRGWLDHSSARGIHCLLETAGARWLVTAILQELQLVRYKDRLERGVEIALACFHVDIRGCTIELLTHTLPRLLYNSLQTDNLMEPQLSAVAKLTSHCVYAALDKSTTDEQPPAKKPRTMDGVVTALKQLLTSFESHIQDGQITQQTYFTFHLLQNLVDIRAVSINRIVLSAISATLVSDLLKTLPELFTPSLLVRLHDLQTSQGRASMARDLCIVRNYQLRHSSTNNI
ncbi:PREDICTED: mediator of RNA polymerase II transcription subunit 24 [Nicrophorus vespilloides]|uniref:Mediator of RNA polymerase II transcription subunit 24 n=1 Tax=Nicrophorus vespilloides TaxID=110193 RepID=A0ABM1MNF4_NICVS|nr:PREDICTED: mediator of RNA polymerase II transcription subunit 24 [Nicrophorus vespilloides]XP_017776110.1 PREDICTED: mediator of RNA polymerase II transcription subunit 24 [Nicrophorus vespilloides]